METINIPVDVSNVKDAYEAEVMQGMIKNAIALREEREKERKKREREEKLRIAREEYVNNTMPDDGTEERALMRKMLLQSLEYRDFSTLRAEHDANTRKERRQKYLSRSGKIAERIAQARERVADLIGEAFETIGINKQQIQSILINNGLSKDDVTIRVNSTGGVNVGFLNSIETIRKEILRTPVTYCIDGIFYGELDDIRKHYRLPKDYTISDIRKHISTITHSVYERDVNGEFVLREKPLRIVQY